MASAAGATGLGSRRLDGPTQRIASRKLATLDASEVLTDLRVPPETGWRN